MVTGIVVFLALVPVCLGSNSSFQGNAQLLAALNAALVRLYNDGTLATLDTRWTNGTINPSSALNSVSAYPFPAESDLTGTMLDIWGSRTIVFGGNLDMSPFGSLSGGVPVGFEVDLSHAIAAQFEAAYPVNTSIEGVATHAFRANWTQVPMYGDFFGDLFFALANENPAIDVAMSNIFITAARALKIDYSLSYFGQSNKVARGPKAWTGGTFTSESTLISAVQSGLLVGVTRGTAEETYANASLLAASIRIYDTYDKQVQALRDESVHVIISGEFALRSTFANEANVTILTFAVGTMFENGMMVRKDGSDPVTFGGRTFDTITVPEDQQATGADAQCLVLEMESIRSLLYCYPNCNHPQQSCGTCHLTTSCGSVINGIVDGSTSEGDACCGGYHCCSQSCTQICRQRCTGSGKRRRCRSECRDDCQCTRSTNQVNSIQAQSGLTKRQAHCYVNCVYNLRPYITASFEGRNYTVYHECGTDGSCPGRFYRGMQAGQRYPCAVDTITGLKFRKPIPDLNQAGHVGPPLILTALVALLVAVAMRW